jgi:CRISPR-associated endonuclease/helicase Cas3
MDDGIYYAHSANPAGKWHRLVDHLQSVGNIARNFAGAAAWSDEAGLSGATHDLGKYASNFQRRFHGEAYGLDHW